MVSRLTRLGWPEGVFVDTIKIRRKEWFYITEPHEENWVGTPDFGPGPRARLASWSRKGIDWEPVAEVKALQKCVTDMIEAGVTLTNMVQIMLHRSLLPCQCRATPMWSWKPEDPRIV